MCVCLVYVDVCMNGAVRGLFCLFFLADEKKDSSAWDQWEVIPPAVQSEFVFETKSIFLLAASEA